MFLSIKHKLLSLNLPLLFYSPVSFLGENVPSSMFWRTNGNPIPIPFVMQGRYKYD